MFQLTSKVKSELDMELVGFKEMYTIVKRLKRGKGSWT